MGILDGRIAIVTGASRGIGAEIARHFGREGAAVAVVARTTEAGTSPLAGTIRETAGQIRAAGGAAVAIRADLFYGGELLETLAARTAPDFLALPGHLAHPVVDGAVDDEQAVRQKAAGSQEHDRGDHGRDRVDRSQRHALGLTPGPNGKSPTCQQESRRLRPRFRAVQIWAGGAATSVGLPLCPDGQVLEGNVTVGAGFLRQPEDSLADDAALDLVCTPGDG
jgi:hypothetical protein